MSRRPTRKLQKRQADELFSKFIRARDGQCRRCGTQERLQCAHVVSRRYIRTRHDPRNAVCLCAGCHFMFTNDPLRWDTWADENVPDHDELKKLALNSEGWKPDYDEILAWLKQELEDVPT